MTVKIYRDDAANSVFIEDANGAQFLNSLQASVNGDDLVSIQDIAKGFDIVSSTSHTEFVDENDVHYAGDAIEVCNELNAIFQASGTSSNLPPTITSSLIIASTQGDTVNYELTTDYGVGYEWDFSDVSGIVNVEGNPRKIIGGSSLSTGVYSIPVKAINYNGEDSQTIQLVVSNPSFANTKSVRFNNNDWLNANAGILQNVLGRTGNGSGSSDAWSIALWFKPGTSENSAQTIFYFGNQDVANQGYIQLKYNGNGSGGKKFEFRYGSNSNRINLITPVNGLTPQVWHHVLITYDGGTTGAASGSVDDYYSRFKFFIDGALSSTTNTNSNYGYTGSITAQNLRVGRWNNSQYLRNNCKIDELAIFNADVSSLAGQIYGNGVAINMMDLETPPRHWWRMGDGDTFPFLYDVGVEANCIFVMQNMTSSDIVNDVPNLALSATPDPEPEIGETQTQYFSNQTDLEVDFIDGSHPIIDVFVFDASSPVPSLEIYLEDADGTYSGTYSPVGVIAVASDSTWTNDSDHKLFKHSAQPFYIAYHQAVSAWVVFTAENDHNLKGQIAETSFSNLNNAGSLPASYAGFGLSVDLEALDTTELIQASPSFIVDLSEQKISLSFGAIPQTGVLIYK